MSGFALAVKLWYNPFVFVLGFEKPGKTRRVL